ncbi:cell wall metabolism sensor histidine kinase WalK [Clostridium sp. YIM B02551]|uniref:sensor histidine kinase n=1 Tax=Clostridium sp. YIM B02551 TaxID=2910679 RepID=UPI001EECB717|nr:HAMP domain-containing sensor histidine kinase [Clostridium sp. YIM B02551]
MKINFKFPNTKSLRFKLLSRFLLILLFLLLVIGAYQYFTMKQYLYKSKEQVLEARIHNVDPKKLSEIQSSDSLKAYSSEIIDKILDNYTTVAIIDSKGNIVAGDSKTKDENGHNSSDILQDVGDIKEHDHAPISIPNLSSNYYLNLFQMSGNLEGYSLVKDQDNNLQIVIWRKVGSLDSPAGLIQLSTSAKQVQDILLQQIYIYVVASILVLFIGSLLGVTIFKLTLKPLYNVTDTVGKINAKQLYMRLPINTGQTEIDTLSNSFNNMLERIEISFEQEQIIREKMRQFVSDASHELRTPLTSIHGFVEVLLRGAAKNEKQLDLALNSILIESDRLTKLVNDLLLLTKLDQKVNVEIKRENINEIIEEVFPQLQILSGKRAIELQLDKDLFVDTNKNQIKQVIFNLVQNAVQHTDEINGVITINTSSVNGATGEYLKLQISDNGTGIPKEHLTEIFDRFFRSELHRSRKHGGYGLGLSIVKSIIDSNNGNIKVDSELNKGTTFTIYLKVSSS